MEVFRHDPPAVLVTGKHFSNIFRCRLEISMSENVGKCRKIFERRYLENGLDDPIFLLQNLKEHASNIPNPRGFSQEKSVGEVRAIFRQQRFRQFPTKSRPAGKLRPAGCGTPQWKSQRATGEPRAGIRHSRPSKTYFLVCRKMSESVGKSKSRK